MFGYDEHEIVGRDPDDLVGLPDDSEAADISRSVIGGQIVHATSVRRRKDGRRINVELHAIPLTYGNGFQGCFGIYQDITERIESEARLRSLRSRLTRVQDEERAHIARELHDDIAQRLAVLTLELARLQQDARGDAPALAERLAEPRRLAEDISCDVERVSRRLHPSQLAYLGLSDALAAFCDEFARQNRMTIDVVREPLPELPMDVATCLYRVAQEALRNVQKHSGSERVTVSVSAGDGEVRLCVRDQGRGFDVDAAQGGSGLGLVSMTERVRGAGGDITIRSDAGRGTRVEVSIPVA
jgi:signal transduction histidine kinase